MQASGLGSLQARFPGVLAQLDSWPPSSGLKREHRLCGLTWECSDQDWACQLLVSVRWTACPDANGGRDSSWRPAEDVQCQTTESRNGWTTLLAEVWQCLGEWIHCGGLCQPKDLGKIFSIWCNEADNISELSEPLQQSLGAFSTSGF